MKRKVLIELIRKELCEMPTENISIDGLAAAVQNRAYDIYGIGQERIPSAETIKRVIYEELRRYKVIERIGRYRYVSRRAFVPPLEFLDALDRIYRERRHHYGTPILWDSIYDRVCQLTLLDSDFYSVQNTLRAAAEVAGVNSPWAKRKVFDYGWSGGRGLWVLLLEPWR